MMALDTTYAIVSLKCRCSKSSLELGVSVWSNFEIADMDFWRSEAYQKFFDHLESKGGFYYEVISSLDWKGESEPPLTNPFVAVGRCTSS